ncbi:unnamed protein product (macronuclear) [Paramecium tetraurelia]|uniref:Casein kinase I n=1 Tax=Paramecium tetraurelia TaxID=5888 RepID=A0DEF3_PARTE|nr:uncharacterized protein GSPATT00016246001 [Paramecium tetraurelia]CAK81420.1 unnamed protein product [Paramecium tetraurelia]|eukprot:XP_001448817.1 hypothetical protein (macronuclear) [Paramecium tetraurelia strain d4-2]
MINQKLINNTYTIKKRISSGSFGVVYLGQEINTRNFVAIKVDKEKKEESSLQREAEILKRLQHLKHIPKLYWSGKDGDSTYLVIQYLGRDLTHYIRNYRKFSLKCVLNIAEQMIIILESLHKHNVIHRDIKPENILVGKEDDENQLFIVDFGISKFYKEQNESHISFKEKQPFIGTTRYASSNAHKRLSLSRRDDMESLCYMLIYLLKGQLPWQNLQFTSEEDKINQVGQMKMRLDSNELCQGLPIEFAIYLDYVKGLHFKLEPNYKYCLSLFRKVSKEHNFSTRDLIFDWVISQKSERDGQSSERDGQLAESNPFNSKPSLFKKSKDDPLGSQLNQSIEQENNQLRKMPDKKRCTLTPEINRKKNRLLSVNSNNDTVSDNDFNNSIMIGIQPSILSRLSKISFNSNSKFQNSISNNSVNPNVNQFNHLLSISPDSDLENILNEYQRKSQTIQPYNQILNDDDTTIEFQMMNEGDEGIERKYIELKLRFIRARFKPRLNNSLK